MGARKRRSPDRPGKKNVLAYAHVPYLIESRLSGLSFTPENFDHQAVAAAERIYGNNSALSSKLDLVTLYLEYGMVEQAQPLVRELIQKNCRFNRNNGQSSQPYFYSARIEEMKNNREKAIADLKKSLEYNPGDPWTLSHLTVLTEDTIYKNKIIRYFDEIDAEYFMGLAYLADKKYDSAVKSFSYVIQKMPEYRNGFIYLAIGLGGANKFPEAARYYSLAMQKNREPLFKEKEILDIFRGWAAQEPINAQAQFYLATALSDFGYYEDAITVLSGLRDRFPTETLYLTQIMQFKDLIKKYKNRSTDFSN